jgi:hypothetical protein
LLFFGATFAALAFPFLCVADVFLAGVTEPAVAFPALFMPGVSSPLLAKLIPQMLPEKTNAIKKHTIFLITITPFP